MATMTFAELKKGKMKELLTKMEVLKNLSKDNSDVFKSMIEWHNKLVDDNWETQGRFWGKRWQGLTPKYKAWKIKQGKPGKADLMLNRKLRDAATGKSGDMIKNIGPDKATWEIDINAIPYARRHQWGDGSYQKLYSFKSTVRQYAKTDKNWKAIEKQKIQALEQEYKHGMPQRPYFMMYDGTVHPMMYEKYSKLIQEKIERLKPKV